MMIMIQYYYDNLILLQIIIIPILERSYENNDILIEICSLISILTNRCDISIHAFRNTGLK